jgi:predicted O-methyltransferase YrrM
MIIVCSPSMVLISVEHSRSLIPIFEEAASQSNCSASIQSLVATLKEPYDLIFIDADKTSYPTYLSLILSLSPPSSVSSSSVRLLKKDGIILADNILRRGLIADSSEANPWSNKAKQTAERTWKDADGEALDQFNKALVGSERCDTFLMPMFDGLGMGRLVD